MNKKNAKIISETITNEQLFEMFKNAQKNIIDWKIVSNVNKSFSKGISWNILAKDFDINHRYHVLAKKNMVWEFGDYLPENLKTEKKPKKIKGDHQHKDPDFNNDIWK